MKILITGTKGFIGKNLYEELKTFHTLFNLEEDALLKEEWKLFVNEFLNDNQPDAIFHIGACSNTLETDVNYMMTRNFESTKFLMDWAKAYNVPFVYSSSAASYGVNNEYPTNLYGWSKYIAEQYVISNGGVALRYFNVYGPGESHKGCMSSVIYRAICAKLETEQQPFILFPLNPRRDFIYIKDVILANIFALENYESFRGNYYDVGSGVASPFEEIFETLDYPYQYTEETRIPNGYQFYTCSSKSKWMPGWTPTYSLTKGVSEYFQIQKLMS